MADPDTQFALTGLGLRSQQAQNLKEGYRKHMGRLDFTGYLQGRDPLFLGINRANYIAKPFGNDSSNVQAVLGGSSYWKRVYYRPDNPLGEIMGIKDEAIEKAAETSGYKRIRADMKDMLENIGRPKFPHRRLSFHSCLADQKYSVNNGAGLQKFDYDRQGHRSSKSELNFIATAYFRKDMDLVMKKEHYKPE